METRPSRIAALVAYQLTLLIGIALFPIAVLANKVGVPLPIHRVLGWLDEASKSRDSR